MRALATSMSSLRFPNVRAPDGQTSAHAGPFPSACRLAQKVHFRTRGALLSYSYFGTSNGQAIMQYLQPMQRDASYVTGPVGCLTIAWTGQADAHAGATQCMHWRFTNRSPPGTPTRHYASWSKAVARTP